MSVPGDKPKRHKTLKAFLVPILRQASLRWWARNEAFTRARVERGLYKCALCEGLFKRAEVHADHISPVVKIKDGFDTWDIYIESLFIEPEGYAILCISCHESKTEVENETRKLYRNLTKEKKSSKIKEKGKITNES